MATIGDTVRLKCEFKNWAGDLTSPTNVKIIVYSEENKVLLPATTVESVSAGKYKYDYTIPIDAVGNMYFEFSGTLETKTIIGRMKLERKWA